MTAPQQDAAWVWLARIRRPQGRKGEVFADILTDFPEKFADRPRLFLIPDPDSPRPKSIDTKSSGHPSSQHAGETRPAAGTCLVSGHDFSRAARSHGLAGALAPEGISPAAAPREVELLAHWPHKGGMVFHFAQTDSISAAEALKGLIVAVPRAERTPLADDEVYIADLIGCTLFNVAETDGANPALISVGVIEDVDRTAGPVALLVVRSAASEILIPFAKSYLRRLDLKAKRVEMALPEGLIDLNAPGKA